MDSKKSISVASMVLNAKGFQASIQNGQKVGTDTTKWPSLIAVPLASSVDLVSAKLPARAVLLMQDRVNTSIHSFNSTLSLCSLFSTQEGTPKLLSFLQASRAAFHPLELMNSIGVWV